MRAGNHLIQIKTNEMKAKHHTWLNLMIVRCLFLPIVCRIARKSTWTLIISKIMLDNDEINNICQTNQIKSMRWEDNICVCVYVQELMYKCLMSNICLITCDAQVVPFWIDLCIWGTFGVVQILEKKIYILSCEIWKFFQNI